MMPLRELSQGLSHGKRGNFGVETGKINIAFTNSKTAFFHIVTSLNQYVSSFRWWPGRWVIISQFHFLTPSGTIRKASASKLADEVSVAWEKIPETGVEPS